MKNKFGMAVLSFFATSLILGACSDWTDIENVEINQPGIQTQNPELYTKYLENLVKYKKSEHKFVYAWFDNSEKLPYSRSQHLTDLPDSIDVVILTHPDNLVEHELQEMEKVRQDKGTRIIHEISYEDIKTAYDKKVKDNSSGTNAVEENEAEAEDPFLAYLEEQVGTELSRTDKYGYDGICIGYNGKRTLHMTDNEKMQYTLYQQTYFNAINVWLEKHIGKWFAFKGLPQNLLDKSFLSECKHIILDTAKAASTEELTFNILEAIAEEVPTDRFIVGIPTVSLDTNDNKTGYFHDGKECALTAAALWTGISASDFTKAGLGVFEVQHDYYSSDGNYHHVKEAINIMNPAPIIK